MDQLLSCSIAGNCFSFFLLHFAQKERGQAHLLTSRLFDLRNRFHVESCSGADPQLKSN